MEQHDRPHAPHAARIWFGAPVAMVLATCVSSQVAAVEKIVPAALQPAPGIGCVVRGEADHARKALARQAAYTIHASDWACARTAAALAVLERTPVPAMQVSQCFLYCHCQFDPTQSNHQTSAP